MSKKCYIFAVSVLLIGALQFYGCNFQTGEKPSNIVLISLDTVRAGSLGYAGNQRALTPNIDALARQGMHFTQAISTNSLTTPAHSSLFTGRYPTAHAVHTNGIYALPSSEKTLAEFLKEHGYYTAGFASSFTISSRFGMSQGFDIYNDQISIPQQERKDKFPAIAHSERSATDVTNAVISWIEESLPADKPFFLFIHFFDAHAPYAPPPDFIKHFGTSAKGRYAGEIAYIDSQFGRIISALDNADLRDNTIFIVVSDHGESLDEHEEKTHGIFIYDSTIRIALFFAGGPILQGKSFHEQVGIIDIMPTIADLLGFAAPENTHGRSLKSILSGTSSHLNDIPYYIESFFPYESFGWSPLIGMRKSSEKLIRAPRPELYDLKHDPLEKENLYQKRDDHVSELEQEFTDFLDSITEESADASTQLSREEVSMLHSLGYAGGVITSDLGERADPKDRIHLYNRMEEVKAKIRKGGNIDASLTELKSLEKEDPDNMILKWAIGQALIAMDRTHEAEEYYLSIISQYPDFTLALNDLTYLLLQREA